tara:strand:+ start:634 stop:2991 length:2358 start_codon:yes stop_codon:yes gene_type:complete
MDFEFNEEHSLFREQLRRFLSEQVGFGETRNLLDGNAVISELTWDGLVEMGITAISIPEEYGGLGLDPLFMCVAAEELGRVCASVPFSSSIYGAAEVINLFGTDAQKQAYLPQLAVGKTIGTWAFSENSLPDSPENIKCRHGSAGLVGVKLPVFDGVLADIAIILSADETDNEKVALLIVDLKQDAVNIKPLNSVDNSRPISQIEFSNAAYEILGGPATIDGWAKYQDLLNRAAVYTAFEQIGGADSALEMARDYALERKTFGRQIGSYQAIKHKLADAYVKIALAKVNALYAAKMIEAESDEVAISAAATRIAASDAYSYTAKENIQTHGGMGMTWEADPHLHYRRAKVLELSLGAHSWNSKLVSELIRQPAPNRREKKISHFDNPEHAEFRRNAQAWLNENLPAFEKKHPGDSLSYEQTLERSKAWQLLKFEAGYAGIFVPKEYGGGGLSFVEEIIFRQEQGKLDVPLDFFFIGNALTVPVLLMYAAEEIKAKLIPEILSGRDVWCQLFSEPGAGSDLAGIRTKSTKSGENWIVNGQKIWNSLAHIADRAILVTRSNPDVPKHKGLTFFHCSMKSEGVDARPIIQMSGEPDFGEVFLDDVVVPDSYRLGEEGDGWKVAMSTLMYERFDTGEIPGPSLDKFVDLVKELEVSGRPAIENDLIKSQLANWYVQSKGIEYTRLSALSALSRGEQPGPEMSIGKLVSASKMQNVAALAMSLQDGAGLVRDPDISLQAAVFQESWLFSPGFRIAGGTDEILRNIIAERVLGFPQEDRPDKDVPFSELKN